MQGWVKAKSYREGFRSGRVRYGIALLKRVGKV